MEDTHTQRLTGFVLLRPATLLHQVEALIASHDRPPPLPKVGKVLEFAVEAHTTTTLYRALLCSSQDLPGPKLVSVTSSGILHQLVPNRLFPRTKIRKASKESVHRPVKAQGLLWRIYCKEILKWQGLHAERARATTSRCGCSKVDSV